MKIKNLLAVVGVGFTILSSSLIVIAVVVVQDNRELRTELRAVRADLNEARAEAGQVREEAAVATAELASKHDQVEGLEEELATAKAANLKASSAAERSPAPRAYRVRTYLGSRYIGMAWMVPSPLPKDAESGQVAYEPVLVLDESVKSNFELRTTNVVEREVSRATTVNYNYAYPYYYPVFVSSGGHRPPNCDTNPVPAQPKLPTPSPRLPPGIFNPVNSKPFLPGKPFLPREKPFLPSDNRVTESSRVQAGLGPSAGNLRPQMVGGVDSQRRTTQPWSRPGS
ncbi:MAG TPA: hypothetical protein VJW76_08510 [Verrucomicrobiae bacterium]|nr:hypothetical protein [Verrucomicrobiae bacterium]